MSPESAPDRSELFVRYFTQYEVNIRAFVASLLPDWDGVDEVTQATSLVMWRKFDQFDIEGPESSFLNWAFVIARFEVLKFRSKKAKDRLVLSDDVYELLADEAEESAAQQSSREKALFACMNKLKPAQRELIQVSYASGISIKEASRKVGRSPTGLYKALARIRDTLHRCIKRTVSEMNVQGNL